MREILLSPHTGLENNLQKTGMGKGSPNKDWSSYRGKKTMIGVGDALITVILRAELWKGRGHGE